MPALIQLQISYYDESHQQFCVFEAIVAIAAEIVAFLAEDESQ